MDFTEQPLSSERVFSGGFLQVNRDLVRLPNGDRGSREYIRHPGAAMIIPRFDNGDLLLVRQFRYAPRLEFLEFPAGKIDPGESPEITAQRELLEETGCSAERWQHLGQCHPCIGYADEVIQIYLAEGLTEHGQPQLDEDEFVEPLRMPLSALESLVDSGEITDGKTLAGLYYLSRLKR